MDDHKTGHYELSREEKIKAATLLHGFDAESDGQFDLEAIYKKAQTTCEVLRQNLVKTTVKNEVFFEQFSSITPQNVVRMCARGQQLYEARADVIPICRIVTEIEHTLKPKSDLWCILL
jgi:hypothetical protein